MSVVGFVDGLEREFLSTFESKSTCASQLSAFHYHGHEPRRLTLDLRNRAFAEIGYIVGSDQRSLTFDHSEGDVSSSGESSESSEDKGESDGDHFVERI